MTETDQRQGRRDRVAIELRDVWDDDLPTFNEYLRDPQSQAMASSTFVDYTDTQGFNSYWSKLRSNEEATVRTITLAGRPHEVVGHIAVSPGGKGLQVSYWIDREHWGQGIATSALRAMLAEVAERPIFANVTRINEPGAAVLQRNGFNRAGNDSGFDAGKGRMIDDVIFRLG
ncbi:MULTISPECIES: GNAT family N-acetyltransferase [unclassified Pseudactinotalea]|uniref:GNAT family N-acetyltransferase n=1 Tax=unclassified Pseudactinotalea TaxID=2649176 RepID=UPI00128DD6F7|nr:MULTISPECIES: GNAT family protein [unclassified Pseudactinotalea]MPV50787.1 GNAT family N-acetyltransferase [Pseudactinotalea sp. HY160]QGH70362.1 GNAT family N-acetyltransferase [Pseudactinotalea sp. HY158]